MDVHCLLLCPLDCGRPFKGGMAVVKEDISEERRGYNRMEVSYNSCLRKLQAGDEILREIVSQMEFKTIVPVKLKRLDIPRFVCGKVGETDPKNDRFTFTSLVSGSKKHIKSWLHTCHMEGHDRVQCSSHSQRNRLRNTSTADSHASCECPREGS